MFYHFPIKISLFMCHTCYLWTVRLVEVQMPLVADPKLIRIQRKKYHELQAKLHEQWDLSQAGEKTARQLLKLCSKLYGPTHVQWTLCTPVHSSKNNSFRSQQKAI